jgi:class 3 adenylate cyclase/predicted ATPase
MRVGDWLRSLGLGQYEAVFRESEIDLDVLPELTNADLAKLGLPLGDRKRILKAISSLASPGRLSLPLKEPVTAERRQLTVMFCDLVGSTALSARLDPEDLHGVIGAYHRCCTELVERNGGFVAEYMGDGVLAYFGYPQAHEHDAERAVRAGLSIVEATPKLKTLAGGPLRVRIGVATGVVVVGDILGAGQSRERAIVGETPNLAARLQGIAEPGSVVIAESTRKLLGDIFELADLGPQDLKGIAGPTRVWATLREGSQENRFEALHAGRLTPMVGREEEIELLRHRWSAAKAGEGQVVLISGEAGIGKSRLTAEFLERVTGEPHTRMRCFCSPQQMDSALGPIIGQIARAAGFAREDEGKTRLDKLDALLAQCSTSRDDAALLAEMLSLASDGRYPALDLAPQQRRQKTLDALVGQIEAFARGTPVLAVLEDAQWADPSSLEMFGRLIDKICDLRVLLLVTFRPEFAAPWLERTHVTALTINRLTESEVAALIEGVAGRSPLTETIRQDIIERADGIPLFVEEMTKAAFEAESEAAAARALAAVPSPALAVPASLHASLMARLDRLGSAKAIAQIGAAMGREFPHTLLASVARLPDKQLAAALDRLLQAGLIWRRGEPPDSTYLFNHALVQDAAYGTLLREPRRALHARIAEAIEAQLPDVAESEPELLARHCAQAGLMERAALLWGKAGERSLARTALTEAEALLTRALAEIAALPGTPALRRDQIRLQVGLANVQMHAKGYAASETKAAFEQARLFVKRTEALGEPLEDPLVLFSLLFGFWATKYMAFNADPVSQLAAQFLALAEKQKAAVPLIIGHRLVGISLLHRGDVERGREHFDRAIALYDPASHRPLATRFGLDIGTPAKAWRALALWLLGYPDAAREGADRAMENARELGYVPTLMSTLTITSWPHIFSGRYAEAMAHADELIALADESGALYWKATGVIFREAARALAGDASNIVQPITSSLSASHSRGASVSISFFWTVLAKVNARQGQFEEAWRHIDEATAIVEATGESWNEADIHLTAGEIALMASRPDNANAQAHFVRALEIARAQQAHSWELRAATSLARLRRDQGRRREAHDLLAPVYGWFTEGFDTPDLKQADALLNELG